MFGSFAKLQALSKKAPPSKASPAALRRSSFQSFSQIPKEIQKKPLPVPVQTASSVQKPGSSKPKGPSLERKEVRNPKIQEYLEGAIRDSSRKTYASYWRRYLEFCKKGSHNIRLEESIGLFLIHLAEKSENRASSLSAKHAIKFYLKLKFPFKKAGTDTYFVSRIVKAISKRWGRPVKKAKRISSEMVAKMIPKLWSTGSFKDKRTAMFIILQFLCMGRFEEVAKLEKSFIEIVPPGNLKIYFPSAKNYEVWDAKTTWVAGNQDGLIDPVKIARDYLKLLPSEVKWLFPNFRLGKKKSIVFFKNPVSYSKMLNLLRDALSSIGENGDDFSLHGIRTGALSEVANSSMKIPRDDIIRHGRWKSDKMVDQYHELSLEKKLAPSKALKFYDD